MKQVITILIIALYSFNSIGQCIDSTLIDLYTPCTFIYLPVCGCDGNTYPNDCVALNYNGVTQWTQGPCSSTACVDSSLIDPYGICPLVYNPVCGCDGVTYSNDCFAVTGGGVTSWVPGPCTGAPCVDPNQIDLNLDCFSGIQESEPVCGCDGNTYINACVAESKFGITQFTTGPCNANQCISTNQANGNLNCTNQPQNLVCGCDDVTYNSLCEAAEAGVLYFELSACVPPCVDPDLIDNFANCGFDAEIVCGCDTTNYFNNCTAVNFYGIIDYTQGPCATSSCVNQAQIAPNVNCSSAPSAPVCGCDGVTYANECAAFYSAGLSSWSQGPCVNTNDVLRKLLTIEILPNPVENIANIAVSNPTGKKLNIYLNTIAGKKVREIYIGNEVNLNYTFDVDDMEKGIYLLTITSGESVVSEKLITQ